jgi:hypothetical protein
MQVLLQLGQRAQALDLVFVCHCRRWTQVADTILPESLTLNVASVDARPAAESLRGLAGPSGTTDARLAHRRGATTTPIVIN